MTLQAQGGRGMFWLLQNGCWILSIAGANTDAAHSHIGVKVIQQ